MWEETRSCIHEVVRFAWLQQTGERSNLPDVHAALRSRIDQLPLTALELLQVVAVAGHPIPERSRAQLLRLLAQLWRPGAFS